MSREWFGPKDFEELTGPQAQRMAQGIGIVGELRRIVDSIDAVAREGGDTSELVARASALIDLLEARL